jgi:2-amino-4-hydroxy-6-hydroxymethyldihydropteridine diphosphokinase
LLQLKLKKKIGQISHRSNFYQTAAWGKTDQADFLNQVIIVDSKYTPEETIEKILQIESAMGRSRTQKNAPRLIDIDILFFNKEIIKLKSLIVPHIEIQNRRFALVPLNELSPNFKHPVLNKTIHQLLLKCQDKLEVKEI